jgi:penicillin-binding protein 1A
MLYLEKGSYLKWIKWIWISFVAFWGLFIFYIFAVSSNLFGLFGPLPDFKSLENPKSELASELYSADGVLMGKYFVENRSPVEYEQISPNVINALVATEDVRFERHSGIDFKATLSIPWYVLKGDPKGSSTLSQQVAKNLYRTRGDETMGSLGHVPGLNMLIIKTKEWITAINIEQNYTKREIIRMYLNTVDFGSNAFGIRTAARTYFRKEPHELSIAESALLVGVLKSTTFYNPIRNPNNAFSRRNTVLAQMQKYGYLSEEEFGKLKQIPIAKMVAEYEVENHNKGMATYFRSYIQNELIQWCRERNLSLYRDGLRIYTTIDSRMQRYAEEAVVEHMSDVQKRFNTYWKGRNPWRDEFNKEIPNFIENVARRTHRFRSLKERYGDDEDSIWIVMKKPVKMRVFTWKGEKDTTMNPMDSIRYYKRFLHTGLMAMNPENGEIKAWVGGIDFKYFQYDHVKQGRRQPGSSFKPIIYTAAIDNGFTPCTQVTDATVTFPRDENGKAYTPQNSDGPPSGEMMTLRRAIGRSVNTVSAHLVYKLGATTIVDYARNLGITSPLEAVPSIALGTPDVSMYELLGVYSTFVNSGFWTQPKYITRIEDRKGNVLWEVPTTTRQALSEETAYTMVHMLKGPIEEPGGTARGLYRYKFTFKGNTEVGGKTGTTQNNSDGWFVGITPKLVAGVWVGGDDRSIHFRGKDGEGGRIALPEFGLFMDKVFADSELAPEYKNTKFKRPKNLSISLDCNVYQDAIPVSSDSTYVAPSVDDSLKNAGLF